ncbi:NYN domain-containing protein [Corynebacterium sp. TA-R-1]|uniref:NYN domain-containing protein n=1 Tax=Corynebacterium stercoris TaxID=2943490 RepID=A0ABT1G2E4_9CORY|nr:NYN domain-containing protein [Corynebacterium stercoris]MCP1388189.1 NYN domain-containing protein [Corynebacterium stercoris]
MGRHSSNKFSAEYPRQPIVTAILVDGGFYRHRAKALFGDKTPRGRADELFNYCKRHIRESQSSLYRIFYYDCPPSSKVLYHPLTQQQVNLGQSAEFQWMTEFLKELVKKRKVALRRGEELETQNGYSLKPRPLKKLCRGEISVQDLKAEDFSLDITQKGVDMRIGLDIASLAERGLVNQIVMISGDSDFVPAAKHARRSGIDFVLDPMWATVSDSLNEHVDGVRECVKRPPKNEEDPLFRDNPEPDGEDDL